MSLESIDIKSKITDIRAVKPYHALVHIEPLERGFGHTLGNALRRVMLSSIPGYAATEVKIDGVIHEFDRIEGMREDVVRLILNLKGVVFNLTSGESEVVKIDRQGPCTVVAKDIELPHNVAIINPDHVLATLSDGARLQMEITIEKGVGYEAAVNRESGSSRRFGVIYLDSVFSPVRRASFQVENTRVGNRTDLDRLILDVESNGVHSSEDIIQHAAGVLIDQLSVFARIKKESMEDGVATALADAKVAQLPLLQDEIAALELTVRSQNCLHKINIRYVGELVQKSEKELMRTPHLGKKSLVEIKAALAANDLHLGMEIPGWVSPRVTQAAQAAPAAPASHTA